MFFFNIHPRGFLGNFKSNVNLKASKLEGDVATFDTKTPAFVPQVCAVDNRGTGYSGYPPGEIRWTTHRMAQDALAVLDDLKWQKVHIIGISMGGMIAQEMWFC